MQTAQRPPKTLDEAIARWMAENGPSAPPAATDADGNWASRLSESIDVMLANEARPRRGRSNGRCRRR